MIEQTFITEINKLIYVYGAICYFDEKSINEAVEIVSFNNLFKFSVVNKNDKKCPRFSAYKD